MGSQHVFYILGCPCRQSDLTANLGDSNLSSAMLKTKHFKFCQQAKSLMF